MKYYKRISSSPVDYKGPYEVGVIYHKGNDHNGIMFTKLDDSIKYIYGQGSEIISKQENMKLETTKEKVLAAASKCRSAKQALSELFPEAFEEDGVFVDGDLRKLADVVDKIYFNYWLKIPGDCSKDKAESISKLIYNTWIKNAHV